MTIRTDVHSPTNLKTEDYDYLGSLDWGDSDSFAAGLNAQARRALIEFAIIQPKRRWAHVHPNEQCDHCGAHIRYAALLLHIPTNEVVEVGETCLENRFERATADFQRLRKAAQLDREAQRIKHAVEAFAQANPGLAFMAEREVPANLAWNNFVVDLHRKLHQYGELSERQVAALQRTVDQARARDAERAARKASEAANSKPAQPAVNVPDTSERLTITGTVLSVKYDDEGMFPGLKMRVETDAGYRLYGTVPSKMGRPQPGDRVQFVATVKPSRNDPTFGYYSRPAWNGKPAPALLAA